MSLELNGLDDMHTHIWPYGHQQRGATEIRICNIAQHISSTGIKRIHHYCIMMSNVSKVVFNTRYPRPHLRVQLGHGAGLQVGETYTHMHITIKNGTVDASQK